MKHVDVTKEGLERIFKGTIALGKLNMLVDVIIGLILSKNSDYGNAWQRFGIFTPLIRINDKILRVQTLSGNKTALVADETIKDTLMDIVGYGVLALLWLENDASQLEVISIYDILKSYLESTDNVDDTKQLKLF